MHNGRDLLILSPSKAVQNSSSEMDAETITIKLQLNEELHPPPLCFFFLSPGSMGYSQNAYTSSESSIPPNGLIHLVLFSPSSLLFSSGAPRTRKRKTAPNNVNRKDGGTRPGMQLPSADYSSTALITKTCVLSVSW